MGQTFEAVPVDLLVHSWRVLGDMSIGLEMEFDNSLDERILRRAAMLLLDAEPILGCRLVAGPPVPHWERVRTPASVLRVTRCSSEYRQFRQSQMDATQNVQVSVMLLQRKEGDCLLVKMTHEVGDGAALQYVAARLGSTYSALCLDPAHCPTPNDSCDRDLTQVLAPLPRGEYFRIVWEFVRFVAPLRRPRQTQGLPLPSESVGASTIVCRALAPTRVAVVRAFAKARQATLNDMFLAAAYRALASYGWDGTTGLRIPITVNLRRWSSMEGYRGPVSNLSAYEWPFLAGNLGADFEETLANVRAKTMRRKQSRPGFALAIMTHLWWKLQPPSEASGSERRRRPQKTAREPQVTFSNEGALDAVGLRFGPDTPSSACVIPPFYAVPRLHLSLSGYRGALRLLAVTSENGRPVVEGFFDALIAELPDEAASPEITHFRERNC